MRNYRISVYRVLVGILLMGLGYSYGMSTPAVITGSTDHPIDTIQTAQENEVTYRSFRVLDIGNSYTSSSTCYLRDLTENLGVDTSNMCLYRTVFAGGTFKNWYDVYTGQDNSTYYIQKVFGGLQCQGIKDYEICNGSVLFRTLLNENEWDLIIIHQASRFAPYYGRWLTNDESGYLEELLSVITECQPQAELGTHLVHSYSDNSKFNKPHLPSSKRWRLIASSARRMSEIHSISVVIPYGTVIERLRTTPLNDRHGLLYDGTHLSEGLACYAANCCYYECVFAPVFEKSMEGNTLRPEGDPSVTDESAPIVWEAVRKACKDPFQIEELTSPLTGIKARIIIDGQSLLIKDIVAGEEIRLYTPEGQLLKRLSINSSESSVVTQPIPSQQGESESLIIKLPKGVSVLRINDESIKLFIP